MSRKPMTRAHWDQLFRLHFKVARQRYPTLGLERLRGSVYKSMTDAFGPRPPAPPKPPILARLGSWALTKKLGGIAPLEVPMLGKKLLIAVIFGIGAITMVVENALADGVIAGGEWAAIVGAFLPAFWGKFSSNTTVIAPSRDGETVHGPEV